MHTKQIESAMHTPGPWLYRKGSVFVDTNDGEPIAQAYFVSGGYNAGSNARLIAAAPDLLAALRGIIAMADDTPDGYVIRDDRVLDAARAAIAKATP